MIRLKAGVDNPGFGSGVYTGQVFSLDYQKGDPAVFSVSGGAVIVNVAGIYTCDLEITTSGGGPIEAKLSTQYISKICGSTSPTVDGTLNAATTRYFVAGTSVSAAVYNFGGVTTIMADSTNNPCGFSVVRIPNS